MTHVFGAGGRTAARTRRRVGDRLDLAALQLAQLRLVEELGASSSASFVVEALEHAVDAADARPFVGSSSGLA